MATKITYATLGGDTLEELHRELDAAIAAAPQTFDREHLLYIDGKHLKSDEQFEDLSPIDAGIVLGRFQKGTREHVKTAVSAARAAYPQWAALPWQQRLAYVQRIADAIRTHRFALSALMGYEVGKNRLECVGDVEEAADLISYYCDQIEQHGGFVEKWDRWGPAKKTSACCVHMACGLSFRLSIFLLRSQRDRREGRLPPGTRWFSSRRAIRRSLVRNC